MWGGSDTGLMKVVTDGVQPSGKRLAGISVGFLRKWVRKDAAEMTFARDLAERKARLLAVSDALMVMPGGVGTLREATEVLELRKHGPYDGPVVLLNSALPSRLRYRGGPCGVRRPGIEVGEVFRNAAGWLHHHSHDAGRRSPRPRPGAGGRPAPCPCRLRLLPHLQRPGPNGWVVQEVKEPFPGR